MIEIHKKYNNNNTAETNCDGLLELALLSLCVFFWFGCCFLLCFSAGAGQLNYLSWCTGVHHEAIKEVLSYNSMTAPPLIAGTIVADLWENYRSCSSRVLVHCVL